MLALVRATNRIAALPSRRVAAAAACSWRASSTEAPAPAEVKKVGVLGAGQMGNGIAQVAAQVAKMEVTLVDVQQEQLDKGMTFMRKLLEKAVAKGKLEAAEVDATLGRVRTSTRMEDLADADLVVEAATENEGLKLDLFRRLSEVAAPHAVLASNTSSISITRIGAATAAPERVVGMHFMNPVPVMKLVEVIPSLATSPATLATTLAAAQAMGKTTAQSVDSPGFIANRLLMPYINEAVQALQEGLGSREDIDTTMRLGCNMPMGPLALADFIGLDTCLAIMKVLHSQLGDSKYRPAHLLVKYVDAGWLGKKAGRGFYAY